MRNEMFNLETAIQAPSTKLSSSSTSQRWVSVIQSAVTKAKKIPHFNHWRELIGRFISFIFRNNRKICFYCSRRWNALQPTPYRREKKRWKLQKTAHARYSRNARQNIFLKGTRFPTTKVDRPQTSGKWSAKRKICAERERESVERIKLPNNFLSRRFMSATPLRTGEIAFGSFCKQSWSGFETTTIRSMRELQTKSIMFLFLCLIALKATSRGTFSCFSSSLSTRLAHSYVENLCFASQ